MGNVPRYACLAAIDKADELIASLDARVAALEERSAPAAIPAGSEGKWAIFLRGPCGGYWYYDRLNGFTSVASARTRHPATFYTKGAAESVVQALNLRDHGYVRGMDGTVYVGPASDITERKP